MTRACSLEFERDPEAWAAFIEITKTLDLDYAKQVEVDRFWAERGMTPPK